MLIKAVNGYFVGADLDEYRPRAGNPMAAVVFCVSWQGLWLQDCWGEVGHVAVTAFGNLGTKDLGTCIAQGVEVNRDGVIVRVVRSGGDDGIFGTDAVCV